MTRNTWFCLRSQGQDISLGASLGWEPKGLQGLPGIMGGEGLGWAGWRGFGRAWRVAGLGSKECATEQVGKAAL